MNPKDTIKLTTEMHKYRIANQRVEIMEKINTALPKRKAKIYDAKLVPLYAERNRLKFNVNQLLSKASKNGNNPNTNK